MKMPRRITSHYLLRSSDSKTSLPVLGPADTFVKNPASKLAYRVFAERQIVQPLAERARMNVAFHGDA
jgi:hypothetical protein